MEETSARFWGELMSRQDGPFALRFIMQPLIASIYAIRDGRRDAKYGRPAYFWAVFTDKAHRKAMINSGWQSIGKVLMIAFGLDLIYQFVAVREFHPLQAVVIAFLLALLPYILLRGPVNRVLRGVSSRTKPTSSVPRATR